MKRYIAYFDFLGYKQLILNNDNDHIRKRIGHILRDLEAALGQGKYKEAQYGVIADISQSNLHCLNISDTIILWTKDDSVESLQELLKVCFVLNYREVRYNFPIRGAVVYGEIDLIAHFYENERAGTYNINSVYGKGLVQAHLKAEELDLSGCIIESTAVEKIKEHENWAKIIDQFAVMYEVPYKNGSREKNYIFRLFENITINEEAFNNSVRGIQDTFSADNKGMSLRSEQLLGNTIEYLRSFVE